MRLHLHSQWSHHHVMISLVVGRRAFLQTFTQKTPSHKLQWQVQASQCCKIIFYQSKRLLNSNPLWSAWFTVKSSTGIFKRKFSLLTTFPQRHRWCLAVEHLVSPVETGQNRMLAQLLPHTQHLVEQGIPRKYGPPNKAWWDHSVKLTLQWVTKFSSLKRIFDDNIREDSEHDGQRKSLLKF